MRPLVLAIAALVTASIALAQESMPSTSTAPATSAPVPQATLDQIEGLFKLAEAPKSKTQAVEQLTPRLKQVIDLARQSEADYPHAPNLYEAQMQGMMAAELMWQKLDAGEQARQTMVEFAQRIEQSDAPPKVKVQADRALLRDKLETAGNRADASAAARAMVQKYRGTDAETVALAYAAGIAMQWGDETLANELLDELQARHADEPGIKEFLRAAGRNSDTAQAFQADLIRLDGSQLKLPQDLAGKVVVLDFWATWCGPCVAEIPHVQEVVRKFQDRGVQLVSISLDENRGDVQSFLSQRDLVGIQTCSEKGREDPTARKYGITAIPSIWVLDRQGRVVSADARENLEQTVEQALNQPQAQSAPAAGQ